MPITPEIFIKTWQTSDSIKEVCTKTRMNAQAATSRACQYRKVGIELKLMDGGGRKPLDVKRLRALAKEALA